MCRVITSWTPSLLAWKYTTNDAWARVMFVKIVLLGCVANCARSWVTLLDRAPFVGQSHQCPAKWAWQPKKKVKVVRKVWSKKKILTNSGMPASRKVWRIKDNTRNVADSMMHGVLPKHNMQDDGLRIWNEHFTMVEAAAESIVSGAQNAEFSFVRASGGTQDVQVLLTKNVLQFYAHVHTPRFLAGDTGACEYPQRHLLCTSSD